MTAPDADLLPRILAHRGASAVAPENTLAAFEAAAAMGARGVEFDVSLLGDGAPVIHHDGSFGRCTDGAGSLATATAERVATLDAGAWFDARFRGTRVPDLAGALDRLAELGLAANLEIKQHSADADEIAEVVAEALATCPRMATTTVVSSFDHATLAALRRCAPDIPRAALWEKPPADWRAALEALGAGALHMNWRHLTPAILDEAAAAGIPVRVYTCNDPAALTPFRREGLAGVITDDPRLFLQDPDWAAWAANGP